MSSLGTMPHNPGMDGYALGQYVVEKQIGELPPGASMAQKIAHHWPRWCKQMKKTMPTDDGFYCPPLLDWVDDPVTMMEVFTVGLPAAFDGRQTRLEVPDYLAKSRGGHAATVVPVPSTEGAKLLAELGYQQMTVVRIVISKFELPSMLPFDPAMIPSHPDQVWLGTLAEGSPLLLDFSRDDTPHATFVGQSGSGKSEAGANTLTQLHLSGEWHFVIVCPPADAPLYQKFADLGHDLFVVGVDGAEYTRASEALQQIVLHEFEGRGKEMTERRAAVWGRSPDGDDRPWTGHPSDYEGRVHPRSGKKLLFVFEECDSWLQPDGADPAPIAKAKELFIKAHSTIAQRGRKVRCHLLDLTPMPYVKAYGGPNVGGAALNNIQFRLACRNLPKVFHPYVFPDTESAAVAEVLTDPNTVPGRAVCRGAVPPEGAFANSSNDTPVQLAYLTVEQREALLDGTVDVGGAEVVDLFPHLTEDPEPEPEPDLDDEVPVDADPVQVDQSVGEQVGAAVGTGPVAGMAASLAIACGAVDGPVGVLALLMFLAVFAGSLAWQTRASLFGGPDGVLAQAAVAVSLIGTVTCWAVVRAIAGGF